MGKESKEGQEGKAAGRRGSRVGLRGKTAEGDSRRDGGRREGEQGGTEGKGTSDGQQE